ncbi:MAG: sensor histidine kinase [Clostridiales Family XIII bacterium]|jgi:signal transduction histidine kinase|nr:sensor histidine kinase [Clostridiales Family XIII bacterium]
MKKGNLILFLLPVITAACVLIWYSGTLSYYDRVEFRYIPSDNGDYDLSDLDFENTAIRIDGNVEFIPGMLLTPEEFDARAAEIQTGRPQEVSTVATSRVRLIFPDDDTYMLTEISINFAETVYINGELRGQAGRPGDTKESEEAGHAFWAFSVKPADGVVEIVRQSSNFVHRDNGDHANIIVGSEQNIRLYMSLATDFAGVAAGLFLALFFVHLTLYFILRSYRANLYFAILCLTWFLRTGVTGAKIFLGEIPSLSWETAFRTEYVTLPIGAIFVLLLIKEVFPGVAQKWFFRALASVSSAFILLCLFAGTRFMSYSLLWYEAFYLAAIAYLAARFAIKLPGAFGRRQIYPEQWASLFGLAVFLYAAVHDAFYSNNIYLFGLNVPLTDLALLIFSFAQMIAMSCGTMRGVAAAREAEQKLMLENTALDRLNQMKTDLMATVSHETRTPLAVMSGYAELIAQGLRRKGVDAQTADDLDQISEEIQRIAKIMDEMQNCSRTKDNAAHDVQIQLADVINQSARLYAPILERVKTRLAVHLADDLPPVSGNPGELTQVMFNLLQNARNHTKNGTVEINGELRAENGAFEVAVTVSDTGTGISPDFLPRAFERHSHGGAEGTGLGLSICKEIVEAHGGRIGISSKVGKGTKVVFAIPIIDDARKKAERDKKT